MTSIAALISTQLTRKPLGTHRASEPARRIARRVREQVTLTALFAVHAIASAATRAPRVWFFLARHSDRLSGWLSPRAAAAVASRSRRHTPALDRHFTVAGVTADAAFGKLPITDKRSYIDAHDLPSRCEDGRLPCLEAELDESAGSTGRAYTWVRSREELRTVHRQLACLATHLLRDRDHDELVTLNAFSMGAWATGTNVSAALGRISLVKSIGPDCPRVLDALDLLGPGNSYAICGYPPFLAELLEVAEQTGVDLSSYELFGFVGGEGMTEELRSRLERVFRRVWSAYGASDLDIGVAAETDLSIAIRQAAHRDPALASALFGSAKRLPMVFQYDPASYYVETVSGPSGVDELVVTVLRRLASPRVRYAVHDAGGTVDYHRALAICASYGVTLPTDSSPRLPLLFVNGRADATVSHLGANLYPEDVEAAVLRTADERPAAGIGSFALTLDERPDGRTRPLVHVEVADEVARANGVAAAIGANLVDHLLRVNADWRAAATESRDALDIAVQLHAPGTGPFVVNATRIKRQYLV